MGEATITLPATIARDFIGRKELARGAMSTVVCAEERRTGRVVALKVLHEYLSEHEAIRRRLRREVTATSRLDHRSIVSIEELINDQGGTALVMEFVDGPSVREKIRQSGPMNWEDVRPILVEVLDGLEQAHRRGIWHRDLSAEHVLLGPEGAKIIGFGLARVEELVGLTMHTRVLGALEAMAPERILGKSYDGRADLYSVGAVAFEMLVGYPPVDGRMSEAFERASRDSGEFVDIPSELPQQARDVLERSLVGDPRIRFASANQMRRAIQGEYDVEMWRGWAGRQMTRCRHCQTPILDGLDACIECGQEIRRLVRQPGGGELMIRVISPESDHQSGSSGLGPEALQRLMELLADHEDTRRFADGRWEYRLPPYVLLSDLSSDDAERISSKLDARNIPHQVVAELPGPLAWIFTHNEGKSTTFIKLSGMLIFFLIIGFGTGWGIGESVMVTAAAAFVVSLFVAQLVSIAVKRRLGDTGDTQRRRGHAFMISTDDLKSMGGFSQVLSLPDGGHQKLRELGDGPVYRELHQLIVLAVDLAQEIEGESRRQWVALVDRLLDVATRLQRAVQRIEDTTTAELMEKLETLEIQLESSQDPEETGELIERRRRLLDEMESHDRADFEVDMLRAELLVVRGALLDLREEGRAAKTTLDTSTELRHVLEAAAEVEKLAPREVAP